DHRVKIGLLEAGLTPGVASGLLGFVGGLVPPPSPLAVLLGLGLVSRVVNEAPELAAGDFMNAQVKRPRDPHTVLGFLKEAEAPLCVRRAHRELAGLDRGELHA